MECFHADDSSEDAKSAKTSESHFSAIHKRDEFNHILSAYQIKINFPCSIIQGK